MTTAEALAMVRAALASEWFSEDVDAALALIEQRLEQAEALREFYDAYQLLDGVSIGDPRPRLHAADVRVQRAILRGGE